MAKIAIRPGAIHTPEDMVVAVELALLDAFRGAGSSTGRAGNTLFFTIGDDDDPDAPPDGFAITIETSEGWLRRMHPEPPDDPPPPPDSEPEPEPEPAVTIDPDD